VVRCTFSLPGAWRPAVGYRLARTLGLTTAMSTDPAEFFTSLEAKGEVQVRLELATHIYNEQRAKLAREWLVQKDQTRTQVDAQRSTAREEETLAIAREALLTAREANRISETNVLAAKISAASAQTQARWAKWAAVIATVAAIIAAKDDLLRLMARVL
jgi:hypothetical protein